MKKPNIVEKVKKETRYPEKPEYYIYLARKHGKETAKFLYELYLNLGNVDNEFKGE